MNTATFPARHTAAAVAARPVTKSPVRIKVVTASTLRASLQPLRVSSNRIWDPNLLDNLHVPLSRYAD